MKAATTLVFPYRITEFVMAGLPHGSWRGRAAGGLALAVFACGFATSGDSPTHHRIITGRDVKELASHLQEAATEGYRVIGSCSGNLPWVRAKATIHLLLESLPETADPPVYVVLGGGGGSQDAADLDVMQEKGALGFGIADHGVIERWRQTPLWAPLPPSQGMESVIIMEMNSPVERWEYAREHFTHAPGAWPALASRIAEGYRIVAVSVRDGAILVRREGAERAGETDPDRFKVISSLSKKKLAVKLDSAAAEGFRVVAVFLGGVKGGSYDLLLERVAEPGEDHEYRFLPRGKKVFAFMNEYGAEGFRVHPATWWIMDRVAGAKVAYKYRIFEAESTNELAKEMDGAAAEGYRFVRFSSSPPGLLVERSEPVETLRTLRGRSDE